MILPDVNTLVRAHREDVEDHSRFRHLVEGWIDSEHAFGITDLVLSGFLGIVKHPRIFHTPTSMNSALEFVTAIRSQPNCLPVVPGSRHWEICTRLCAESGVKGNLVPDAWLAALAIQSGCEWITSDRDFARFPGLKWRHPFDAR